MLAIFILVMANVVDMVSPCCPVEGTPTLWISLREQLPAHFPTPSRHRFGVALRFLNDRSSALLSSVHMGPVRGQQRLSWGEGMAVGSHQPVPEHWALGAVTGALWSGLPAPSSVGSTILDTLS